MIIYKTHNTSSTDLFYKWTRLSGFTQDFEILEDSHLTIMGHVNLHHRGLVNGPVGWALRPSLTRAETLADLGPKPTSAAGKPGTWIKGGKTGSNILSEAQHYAEGNFLAYERLSPGAYRLEIWGCSYSTLAPTTDGLIEVLGDGGADDPYNQLITRIESV